MSTRNNFPAAVAIIGIGLGVILNIVNLILSPVNLWEMMQLSDLGLFIQLYNTNPVLTIAAEVIFVIGAIGAFFAVIRP